MDNNRSFKHIIAWVMLGVISFIVMKFEFPILPGVPFMKMDFSDAIVALSTFVFGPIAGIIVAFVKSGLGFLISGMNPLSLIGQIAAFLASVSFILPLYYVARRSPNKWLQAILAVVASVLSLTVVMVTLNWLVLMPVYGTLAGFKFPAMYLWAMVVPFNLIKGILNGIVTFVLVKVAYQPIKKWVARRF